MVPATVMYLSTNEMVSDLYAYVLHRASRTMRLAAIILCYLNLRGLLAIRRITQHACHRFRYTLNNNDKFPCFFLHSNSSQA